MYFAKNYKQKISIYARKIFHQLLKELLSNFPLSQDAPGVYRSGILLDTDIPVSQFDPRVVTLYDLFMKGLNVSLHVLQIFVLTFYSIFSLGAGLLTSIYMSFLSLKTLPNKPLCKYHHYKRLFSFNASLTSCFINV